MNKLDEINACAEQAMRDGFRTAHDEQRRLLAAEREHTKPLADLLRRAALLRRVAGRFGCDLHGTVSGDVRAAFEVQP